jgi:hypothetical protein
MKTLFVSAVLILCGLATCSFAQGQHDSSKRQEDKKNLALKLSPLLEASSKKELEARNLMRKKKFTAAEAVCQEAIDILSPAPFTQDGAKSLLAEIYLAEGHPKEALAIWEPMYKPSGTSAPRSCFMAIALARTNRSFDGTAVLNRAWQLGERLYFADVKDLPISDGMTPNNVEATALLVLVAFQNDPQHPEDQKDRSRLAANLAPQSSAANFNLAHQLDWNEKDFKAAEPYYRKAYRTGSKLLRGYIERRFEDMGVKLNS